MRGVYDNKVIGRHRRENPGRGARSLGNLTANGVGLRWSLAPLVFFSLNAVWPARGWYVGLQIGIGLVGGGLLGIGIASLWPRFFDARNT